MASEVKVSINTEECVEILLSDSLQTKNQGRLQPLIRSRSYYKHESNSTVDLQYPKYTNYSIDRILNPYSPFN